MADRSGQTLDHYRLETIIGHGTMADVYRARILGLEDTVAIKVIHSHLLDQPSFVERFRREAEVMASLRHPHIVRLLEFVCRADVGYMVMEYLAGGTLEQRLALAHESGNRLAPALAARWMAAIASAVDLAHAHGMIHRDLKPANILFRETGEPVLTDFGLAFLVDRSRLSASNSMTGTPVYLSPEQARGMPGDARSDIYSLGIILYEMLVGQTPFQGPTISVAMKHITEAPPSPRQLGRYLAPEVEGVIMRALAKNPVERYQSAGALAQALTAAVAKADKAEKGEKGEKKAADPARSSAGPGAARPNVAAVRPPANRPASADRSGYASGVSAGERPSAAPAVAAPALRPAPRVPAAGAPAQSVVAGVVIVACLVAVVGWALVSQANAPQPNVGAPQFGVGAEVSVQVPGGTSTSVLRGCPAGFWIGVVGLATNGDDAHVLGRQLCGSDWWYQVAVPNQVSTAWDGVGWIPGANLAPR
jgi:serine/threonine-protein kinase